MAITKETDKAMQLLQRVRHIEIKARGLSEQIFAGQYHSAFRGRGMTFSEVRGYQVGDDVRDIDWNVTARYSAPFVKVFEEERELTVMLLMDMSSSTDFGTQVETKRELMSEIAATLAFSAIQNNDKVGAIFFTDQIELYIPPRSGKKHILYIIRELLGFNPKSKKTDLNVPLSYLRQIVKKRCTAFVLSDFLQSDGSYKDSLTLAARKHDVVLLRTYDRYGAELPKMGLLQMMDAETGHTTWIDSNSASVRLAYREHYAKQVEQMSEYANQLGVNHVDIPTGEDYVPLLINLFRRRS